MQRILLSLGLLVFVGALVVSSTGAFFSDTETSTGNTFTAGELDLKIDNSSYGFDWNNPAIPLASSTGVWGPNVANSWALSDLTNQLFFSFRDLKPGDYGEDTISLHVQNNAWACMAFSLASTTENGVNEPETKVPDLTVGPNEGELQNYLSFLFWFDDGDNVFETGETVIPALSGLPGSVFTGAWLPIAEGGDAVGVSHVPLQAGVTSYIGKGWCFGAMTQTPEVPAPNAGGPTPGNTGFECNGAGDHNIAQTDGIMVDVKFYSEQSRNNANFVCPRPVVTTLTLAKTVLPALLHPDSAYTLSAAGPTPISGIEGAAAVTAAPVSPGVYSLSETDGGFPGAIVTWSCIGNATPEIDNLDGTATVTVAAGEAVGCDATNTYEQTPPPSV